MPNDCNNGLEVRGNKAALRKFVAAAKDAKGQFDLTQFMPMPAELKKVPAPIRSKRLAARFKRKYGANDWYDWAVNNWGTKWGAYNSGDWRESRGGRAQLITYNTAWAPFGRKLLLAVSAMFPDLRFTIWYDEPGFGFEGKMVAKGGELLKDDYRVA
jgi:hypothetical protein